MDTLDTGDILLFYNKGCLSKLLRCVQQSKYSHVAMVLRDPTWIDPSLKGLYYIESDFDGNQDVNGQRWKFGVQIQSFDHAWDSASTVYVRHLHCQRNQTFLDTFKEVYSNLVGRPYDIDVMDWINAAIFVRTGKYIHVSLTTGPYETSYWCSALLGCIYVHLGLLDSDTVWSLLGPTAFSSSERHTLLDWKCQIDDEQLLTPPRQ